MKFWADHDMPGQLLLHEKERSARCLGSEASDARNNPGEPSWEVGLVICCDVSPFIFLFYVHLADRLQTKQIIGQQGQSQVCWA